MPDYKDTDELTPRMALPHLDVDTLQTVQRMARTGKFPGARKADPSQKLSVWLIPWASIKSHPKFIQPKTKNKKGQSAKAD